MDKIICDFCNKTFGAKEEYTKVTVNLPSGVSRVFNACGSCAYNAPSELNGKLENVRVQS